MSNKSHQTTTKQQELIENLKSHNNKVYTWLVQRGVDFSNLSKSASTLATATTFLFSLPKGVSLPPPDDPIPEVIDISKRTMRIIKQNLFWAFFYNILGIPIRKSGEDSKDRQS